MIRLKPSLFDTSHCKNKNSQRRHCSKNWPKACLTERVLFEVFVSSLYVCIICILLHLFCLNCYTWNNTVYILLQHKKLIVRAVMSISSLGYLELFWQRKIVGRGQVSELNFFLDAGKCFFRPEKPENSKTRKLNNSVKNQILKIILQFERGVSIPTFWSKVFEKKWKMENCQNFPAKVSLKTALTGIHFPWPFLNRF